jgi:hypothetical protein
MDRLGAVRARLRPVPADRAPVRQFIAGGPLTEEATVTESRYEVIPVGWVDGGLEALDGTPVLDVKPVLDKTAER